MTKINNFIELNNYELNKIAGGINTTRDLLLSAALFGGTAFLAAGTVVLIGAGTQAIYDAVTN